MTRALLDRGVKSAGVEGVYNSWKRMVARCTDPDDAAFENYGARGIAVCAEWRDFATFCRWAQSNGWARGLTIDRHDNDGGYAPENCRWVTRLVQNQNMRKTHRLASGEAAVELARTSGVPLGTFRSRIAWGWPADLAATAPRGARLRSLLNGRVYLREAGR